MKNSIFDSLLWSFVGFVLFVSFHFFQRFMKKKNLIEKEKIEILKNKNPEKSYKLKENWNEYMNTYVKNISIIKWVFLVGSVFILTRGILYFIK